MKTKFLTSLTLLFCKCLIVMFGFFAIASTAFSCASKAPTETNKTVENITEQKTAFEQFTEVNKAISDSLIVKIPIVKTAKPECDSITQNELNRVLGLLNSYKKSGQNEASVKYDPIKSEITVWQKIPETKNQISNTNKSQNKILKEKIYIKIPVYVPKPVKYTPFWVKILAWIGGLTLGYIGWRIARIFI
jgi:hypothetical protein